MQAAIIQRRDRLEEAMSTAAAATFIGGILLSLGALAVAPILVLFNDSKVTLLAAAASGLILVNTLAVIPNAILQRRFSSVRLTVVDPLEVVAFGIVSIALATAGYGPWALVIGQYAAFVTSTSLVWALARWRPRARLMSFGMWRELAAYSRHVLVSTAIWGLRRPAGRHRDRRQIAGPAPRPVSLRHAPSRPCRGRWCRPARGTSTFPALARISADRERLQGAFLPLPSLDGRRRLPRGPAPGAARAIPDSARLRADLAPGRPCSCGRGDECLCRGRSAQRHGLRAPQGRRQPGPVDPDQPGERHGRAHWRCWHWCPSV